MPTLSRKILVVIIALLMLSLVGYAGYAIFAIVSLPLAWLFLVFVVITAFALLFVVLELVLNRWLSICETRSSHRLARESFVSNNLKELVIVNPNHDIVKVVKELCHFDGGVVWFSSLSDYVKTFSDVVTLESEPVEVSEADLPKDTLPHDAVLKCKTCGIEFLGGIRTNPRSFATTTLIGYTIKCPNGHINSYNKADFTLRKATE